MGETRVVRIHAARRFSHVHLGVVGVLAVGHESFRLEVKVELEVECVNEVALASRAEQLVPDECLRVAGEETQVCVCNLKTEENKRQS